MKKYICLIGLIVLALMLPGIAQASADLVGMGNAPGPAAPGDNAIEWNPAALNGEKTFFYFDLGLLNTKIWTNSFTLTDILYYGGLTEGSDNFWDDQEVNAILHSIPGAGLTVNTDHSTRVKFIAGPLGVSFGVEAHVNGRVDKDLFNILLKGNEGYVDTGEGTPRLVDLTDTGADAVATADAALTYAFPLHKLPVIKALAPVDELYAGAGIHLIMGGFGDLSLTEKTKFYFGYDSNGQPTIRLVEGTDDQALKEKLAQWAAEHPGKPFPLVRAEYTYDPAQIGYGAAVDFGLWARKDRWRAGISLMNVGAFSVPSRMVMEYGILPDSDPSNTLGFQVTDPVTYEENTPRTIGLPWRLNTGLSYEVTPWCLAGAELSGMKSPSGFFYGEMGLGVEINPLKVLPIRLGTNYSFARHSLTGTAGFGLHLGPWKTDLAVAADLKGASLGLNTGIEF